MKSNDLPISLYLIRHGESDGNYARKHKLSSKVRDIPSTLYRLTEKGIREAESTGKWLQTRIETPEYFFCSDMIRAQETAAHLAFPTAAWQIDPSLREVDKLSGHEDLIDHDELVISFAFEQTINAVRQFLMELRKLGGRSALVVSHHNTILAFKYILEELTPLTFTEQKLYIRNAQVLWYTRQNPHAREHAVFDTKIATKYNWLLNVVPWSKKFKEKEEEWIDLSGHQHLKTNEELLKSVILFKRADFS
jgi:broad specificity phosphatase PhoE